jgi:hypothetical protein
MYIPDIDTDVPIAGLTPTFVDLRDRINAAFASVATIAQDVEVTDQDMMDARAVITGTTPATEEILSSPGVVVHIQALLSSYDKAVVESATQIRTYVTNRLIIESTDKSATVRMRALEMLGKISDVGLFTDKTEITMRHRPTEELEMLLRERLTRTIDA